MEKITITLTKAGLKKLMERTGESEAEIRASAAQNGFVVED